MERRLTGCSFFFLCPKAIKQLIATNRPLVGEYSLGVTAESFGHLLDWFGPLDAHFVSRMSETVRRKWFHGAIDATTANTRLATAPRLSFLVRCSATNPFHEPFVLSRKTAGRQKDFSLYYIDFDLTIDDVVVCRVP